MSRQDFNYLWRQLFEKTKTVLTFQSKIQIQVKMQASKISENNQ